MTQPIQLLITGVGGDLGQALVKALRISIRPMVCHGCDVDPDRGGSAFVETFHVVPPADDSTYLGVLDRLCGLLGVDALVPGSEPEIAALSRLGCFPTLPSGIPIVCQEAHWIAMYGDKLRCMQMLSGKIELSPFAEGTDPQAVAKLVEITGFPVVVKDCRSSGSRSLRIVHDQAELSAALSITSAPLVQAFLDNSGGEFSVGVFACDQFVSAIAFQRTMGPVGCSWTAETSTDVSVLEYALKIAQLTNLRGSANVQVRKTEKGVRLLEANPRFSSLVAARAACGFRDAEWAVELALGLIPAKPDGHFRPIRFRRFFHELVDVGEGFKAIAEWTPREAPIAIS